MATYNGEKYILEQLDSLAKQSVLPHELVVCDDGSSDATVGIIKHFAETAPFPVRLHINEANLGYSDNFLKAAGLCQGDWIAFCDQDDEWMPNKIDRVSAVIEANDDRLILVGHDALIGDSRLNISGLKLLNFDNDRRIQHRKKYAFFLFHGFTITCKSRLIKEIFHAARPHVYWGGKTALIGHDDWICLLAGALGDIFQISEPLAIWRRHNKSLSPTPNRKTLFDSARTSISMVDADHYILLANLASDSSDAFIVAAAGAQALDFKINLSIASLQLKQLAANLNLRGRLYNCGSHFEKVKLFLIMLLRNAYLGPSFCSLGLKSLAKDVAFAAGLIAQRKI